MSRMKYEAVATVGEYTNKQGEKKKRYSRVGTVFENDEGKLSLKLDTVPVSPNWSGYIQFFEPKPKQGGQDRPPARSAPAQQSTGKHAETRDLGEGDDLPF